MNNIANLVAEFGFVAVLAIGMGYFIFYVKPEQKNRFLRWTNTKDLICTPFKFVEDGLSSWIARH